MLSLFRTARASKPTARRPRPFRPQVEDLEARLTPSADYWTGAASADWSDGANWKSGSAPKAGDSLVFNAADLSGDMITATVNDLAADTLISHITIQGGSQGFSLSGNEIKLGGKITATAPALLLPGQDTISLSMILSAPRVVDVGLGASLDLSGTLSGDGGVTKTGTGVLSFTGNSKTYTGTTTVQGGELILDGYAGQIPGNLVIGSNTATASPLVVEDVLGNQFLTLQGSQYLPGGSVTVNKYGEFQLDAGTNVNEEIQNLSGSGQVIVGANSNLFIQGHGHQADTFAGSFSGSGNVWARSSGVLTLSGASPNFDGSFLDDGTVVVNNGGAFGTASVTIGYNAVLELGDVSVSNSLGLNYGAKLVAENPNSTWTGGMYLGVDGGGGTGTPTSASPTFGAATPNAVLTVDGVVAGAGLTVDGPGEVVLMADDTYQSGTVVSSGTLLVGGTIGGPVTVDRGATLIDAFGTINGSVTVDAGGTLEGGLANTTGALSFNGSTSRYVVNVSSLTYQGTTTNFVTQFFTSGGVSLDGAALDVQVSDPPSVGSTLTILSNSDSGSITGEFTNPVTGKKLKNNDEFTVDGVTFEIIYSAQQVQLHVVSV
jgi:autotransporter-associated beta strand protein